MNRSAWMFPGQGSQAPGMGQRLLAEFPLARKILSEASERSGLDLESFRRRGPERQLGRPEVAEPLLAALQISYVSLLKNAGHAADVVAGYSAGEVAAYFAADVLSRQAAIDAAVIRGRVLQGYTNRETRMVAVSQVPTAQIEKLLESSQSEIEFAGRNASDHVTLVGAREQIDTCVLDLGRLGASIADVGVSGPWHSRSVAEAAEKIRTQFGDIAFEPPKTRIFTSASGEEQCDPQTLADHLAQQVSDTVMWQNILDSWRKAGVSRFIEVGSGRVLMGILRRNWLTHDQYEVHCLESNRGSIKTLKRLLDTAK